MAASLLRSTINASRRRWALFAFVLLAVVVVGCYNNNTGDTNIGGKIKFKLPAFPESGGNKVEVFTEMHFQPSFRSQEIPRLLPPLESVPITGREIDYIAEFSSIQDFQQLEIPSDVAQNYDDAKTLRTYTINCQVCHGQSLQGDGNIMNFNYSGSPPANLRADNTRSSSNGELFGFISAGGRQGLAARLQDIPSPSAMPEFRRLLTEEERWMLVQFLRNRIGAP